MNWAGYVSHKKDTFFQSPNGQEIICGEYLAAQKFLHSLFDRGSGIWTPGNCFVAAGMPKLQKLFLLCLATTVLAVMLYQYISESKQNATDIQERQGPCSHGGLWNLHIIVARLLYTMLLMHVFTPFPFWKSSKFCNCFISCCLKCEHAYRMKANSHSAWQHKISGLPEIVSFRAWNY